MIGLWNVFEKGFVENGKPIPDYSIKREKP